MAVFKQQQICWRRGCCDGKELVNSDYGNFSLAMGCARLARAGTPARLRQGGELLGNLVISTEMLIRITTKPNL